MKPLRLRSRLGAALACLAALTAHRACGMNFVLNEPGRGWRVATIHQAVTPNLFIEQAFSRADGSGRIVVVSSPAPSDDTDALARYASVLKHVFAADAGPTTLDIEATHLGYLGRESHFPLVRHGVAFACELFVYADGPLHHGVLCANSAADSPAAYSLLARLRRPESASTGVVALAPLKVHDAAISDFPISFRVIGDLSRHRISRIFVTDLSEADGAEKKIQIGDEITAIDGRAAREFDMATGKDTALGRIFLNRRSGDTVQLDLISAQTHQAYTVTLTVGPFRTWFGR